MLLYYYFLQAKSGFRPSCLTDLASAVPRLRPLSRPLSPRPLLTRPLYAHTLRVMTPRVCTVEIGPEPPKGEGRIRRHWKVQDKLLETPEEGVNTLYDVVQRSAR